MSDRPQLPSGKTDPAPMERALIGFTVMHPGLFYCVSQTRPEHFSDQRRAEVWDLVCRAVDEKGQACTPQVIADRIVRAGLMASGEAMAYLVECQDEAREAPDTRQAGPTFASEVVERAFRRFCHLKADAIKVAADQAETDSVLRASVNAETFDLLNFQTAGSVQSLEEVLHDEVVRLQTQQEGLKTGLLSGIDTLDAIQNGLNGGDYVIIGARPSEGKTALGSQLALKWALGRLGPAAPGVLFSLEMHKASLAIRMLGQMTGIDGDSIRLNRFRGTDRQTYLNAIEQLSKAPFEISDTRRLDGKLSRKSIVDIHAEARYYKSRMPDMKWMVVDYVQIINAPRRKGDNREQAVAEVSATLKSIAVELDIAVIALAQLTRPPKDQSAKKRPTMRDLRESGSLEQDADLIVLIHNWDRTVEHDKRNTDDQRCDLVVDKQRNGATGIAKVTWHPKRGIFTSGHPGPKSDEFGQHDLDELEGTPT